MIKSSLRISFVILMTVALLLGFSNFAQAQEPPDISWVEGPTTVDLGDLAQVKLNESHIFANAEDTRKINEYLGEPTDENDLGLIAPNAEEFNWTIMFSYDDIGYVRDDEKADLDADAILKSIKEATDEANKTRIKNGVPAVNVVGWYEEPNYNSTTHNLTWAVIGEDANDHSRIINYNTRLLGRGGVMSATLITDIDKLDLYKSEAQTVISNFAWKPGKSYAEWKSGDKVAEIGLTALIAGGAGAVAAKTGLLSKLWYVIVAGAAAIAGFFRKIYRRIFKKNEPGSYDDPSSGSIQS